MLKTPSPVALAALPLFLVAACSTASDGGSGESGSPASEAPAAKAPEAAEDAGPAALPSAADPLEAMRVAITALQARPEVDTDFVEVQHLLVSFAGTGLPARRSKEEAETLAADLYAKIRSGEDFLALIEEHTDDSPPGIYAMTTGAQRPNSYPRHGMVAAFGDVGWRLSVGEVGVAPFDQASSPYGWHIIKRLQ